MVSELFFFFYRSGILKNEFGLLALSNKLLFLKDSKTPNNVPSLECKKTQHLIYIKQVQSWDLELVEGV